MGVLEERQVADDRWRREVNDRLDEHMERLDAGDRRMNAIEAKIDGNTAITARIEKKADELLEIFGAIKGFLTVAGWGGAFAKWLLAILLVVGALAWYWKTGELPRKP